jgi:hypothetical protein
MGCDYYTWTVVTVVYKKADGSDGLLREFEAREPRYYMAYDPDVHNWYDEPERVTKAYGQQIMYENKQWHCSESAKIIVGNLCFKYNVPIANLVRAYKSMTYEQRY